MKTRLRTIERWTFAIFLFLLPSQLALHFWPSWAFVFGIRVDFLAPAIYLTDILVVFLFVLWIIRDRKWITDFLYRSRDWVFLVIAIALVNTIFSTSEWTTLMRWIKVAEFSFLALYISRQDLLKRKSVILILFYSAIFFSLIGISQFLKGATLGGPFYFLGERTFYSGTPGIALASIFGREFLRAYSTFSHPNSLAGFLGLVLILSQDLGRASVAKILGTIIISLCFILTFSLGGFIAFAAVFILRFVFRRHDIFGRIAVWILGLAIILSLIQPLVSTNVASSGFSFSQSISQRLDLIFISGKMISEKFLIGEGFGTFILNIPRFKGIFSYEWLLQPVHNIFLLTFAETGIVGLLLFCLGVYKLFSISVKNKSTILLMALLFIIVTGFADHYWLTLQQNTIILSLLIGLSIHPHTKNKERKTN